VEKGALSGPERFDSLLEKAFWKGLRKKPLKNDEVLVDWGIGDHQLPGMRPFSFLTVTVGFVCSPSNLSAVSNSRMHFWIVLVLFVISGHCAF